MRYQVPADHRTAHVLGAECGADREARRCCRRALPLCRVAHRLYRCALPHRLRTHPPAVRHASFSGCKVAERSHQGFVMCSYRVNPVCALGRPLSSGLIKIGAC